MSPPRPHLTSDTHDAVAVLEARIEELEAANSELRAFTYSVTHDLRAPLRALEGFSTALLELHGDTLGDSGRDMLGRIRRAATTIQRQIDALLALARLDRAEVRAQSVDLSALVRATARRLEEGDPGRTVSWSIAEGITVTGDAELLGLVVDNLVGNAWKFSSARADAVIEFARSTRANRPCLVVRDNGVGFDMTYAAGRLFTPFARLHRDDEFPGTGVGLCLAQRALQRQGGWIEAAGRVGHGASFSFGIGDPRGSGA